MSRTKLTQAELEAIIDTLNPDSLRTLYDALQDHLGGLGRLEDYEGNTGTVAKGYALALLIRIKRIPLIQQDMVYDGIYDRLDAMGAFDAPQPEDEEEIPEWVLAESLAMADIRPDRRSSRSGSK